MTDIHVESVTHSAPESFGHVIVKEQITTTYHQENSCHITGQKEQVARIGASGTGIISFESSTISTELSSEIMEERLATNLGTQGSLESSTDQEMFSNEPQVTSPLQSSGSQVRYFPEQDANHTLYSIREDHSLVDRNPTLDREDCHQSQSLVLDKPGLDCSSKTKNDSEEIGSLQEETHSVEKKNGVINKPCEGLPSTEETVNDTQLKALESFGSTGDPISCTGNYTPKVHISPFNVVDTSLPMKLSLYLENGVSETTCNRTPPQMSPDGPNFDVSPLQYQCSPETSCTNVPPLPVSRGTEHAASLEGKEVVSNDLLLSSHPQTSPPCRTAIDSLPTFNSERPSNLPTLSRRSFSPWNSVSPQRYFKEFLFVVQVEKSPQ